MHFKIDETFSSLLGLLSLMCLCKSTSLCARGTKVCVKYGFKHISQKWNGFFQKDHKIPSITEYQVDYLNYRKSSLFSFIFLVVTAMFQIEGDFITMISSGEFNHWSVLSHHWETSTGHHGLT
jgi:hypothetical protein